MSSKPGRHVLRTLFFTILFLLLLFVAESPYIKFKAGSFLNAVMGPVFSHVKAYIGLFGPASALEPYALLPAVVFVEVFAIISAFGASLLTFLSWLLIGFGAFISCWFYQGKSSFVLISTAPDLLLFVGYGCLGVGLLMAVVNTVCLFKGTRKSKGKEISPDSEAVHEVDFNEGTSEIEKSEKELAFEKAVAGMSHTQALEVLNELEVPVFAAYPNYSSDDTLASETSVNSSLFETAFKAGNIERENRSNREQQEQEKRTRLDQVFSTGNLREKLGNDVQAEFEFTEPVEVDDAFEIHTPQMQASSQQTQAPNQPQVIYVQQQPQVIYVNLPNAGTQALPSIETKPASEQNAAQPVQTESAAKPQAETDLPPEDFQMDTEIEQPLVNQEPEQEPDPESEDFEPEEHFEKEKSGGMDLVSPVGGLTKAKNGDYVYDIRKFTYLFPPDNLLKHYQANITEAPDIATDKDGHIIVETLSQFKIDTKLVGIQRGSTFTLFELALAKGIRVNSVLSLADNIAMDLAVKSVRILAPIPGKSSIGIEVPNKKRDTVGFDEMLPELKAKAKKQHIPMVLGKTITGEKIVVDLASAPHMLIAGTTGSGKSVCVNGLICSVLYTKTPREVRMILVDPKMVEFTGYNGIPHLLTPVITEPKRAIKAMAWVVEEMERRMAIFTKVGAKKIEDYNQKIQNKGLAREPFPYIMVIVDEFADLMMSVGKELEAYIKRITAVARFTGIHLVLATQRPDATVITGIIKSNMPTQIAFAVSNGTNSRIILDSLGAEKLLGRGDMLYASAAERTPQRIQGAFIDPEIEEIVDFVKTQGEPDYIDESYFEDPEEEEEETSADTVGKSEDMYTRAWRIVAEKGEASASYLQRRLGIGYNRAANLIEQLEADGIVGPARGSKPREVLRYPDT